MVGNALCKKTVESTIDCYDSALRLLHFSLFCCVSLFCSWPVRTLSFSHDSQMIASASEDLFIDIVSHKSKYIV